MECGVRHAFGMQTHGSMESYDILSGQARRSFPCPFWRTIPILNWRIIAIPIVFISYKPDKGLRSRNVLHFNLFLLLRDCSTIAQSYLCCSNEPYQIIGGLTFQLTEL